MSRTLDHALLVLLVAPLGCVGDLEAYTPPADRPAADAQAPADESPGALFASRVQPIVARCAGAACHTGSGSPLKFLGEPEPDDDYAALLRHPSITGGFDPALAGMLLKIDAGDHYGQSYTAPEREEIVAWLASEKDVRGDDGGDDLEPGGAGDPLAVWSGCMTKASWDASAMGSWADKPTQDGDTCSTCHADGAYRFNTDDVNDEMFTFNRTQLYIIGFFTVAVGTDGSQTVVPAYRKLERMGDGTTLHPRFGVGAGDPYVQVLDDFHRRTAEIQTAGQCGPAGFAVP